SSTTSLRQATSPLTVSSNAPWLCSRLSIAIAFSFTTRALSTARPPSKTSSDPPTPPPATSAGGGVADVCHQRSCAQRAIQSDVHQPAGASDHQQVCAATHALGRRSRQSADLIQQQSRRQLRDRPDAPARRGQGIG